MTAAGAAHRIGVACDDEGLALLASAQLALAGFAPQRGALPAQREALRERALDGLVVLGHAESEGPGLIVVSLDPDRASRSLVDRATSTWRSAARPASWESGPVEVPTTRIIAGLGRLRPSLKLLLDTPAGRVGVCSVHGRIISAGVEGQDLLADSAVVADPALKLVIELWRESQGPLDPLQRLHSELGLVCDYADLFAASAGFTDHLERVLAQTLHEPTTGVYAEEHADSDHGVDALRLLFRSLVRAPATTRRALVPDGVLVAPIGMPPWLRRVLPPTHFGRLFFALEDGATLDEALVRSRIGHIEAEAAVVLGVLTGVVVPPHAARGAELLLAPTTPVVGRPPSSTTAPAPPPRAPRSEPMPPPVVVPLPPAEAPADGPPTPRTAANRELDARACGAAARFFEVLRNAAESGRRAGRRPRLTGTRFEPVGEQLDDVLLYFRVGAGGTGEVFLGVQGGQAGFQKVVAVKRLGDTHADEERFRDRFLDEARLAARLEHPNLVPIFRLLEEQRRHHMIMEFVHGVSVSQLSASLRLTGELAPESVVRWIGAEVARGLHYMHQRRNDEGDLLGLVHRDVAPPNILLGFDGSVKLIDFSIAQAHGDPLAAPGGHGAGRLGYCPPQMLVGKDAGDAGDLFGLAVTLYELLVGEHCFVRDAPAATVDALVKGDYVPILERRPDVSPRLAHTIELGLTLRAAERYRDVASFRQALLADASEPDPIGRMERLLELR
ncbi:MAG: serine/threonine protein kinase, partial [Polyangiaceae bacterium]|nr:serine/threonine protein kinase [Polyangiaceae bacterium]